MMKPKTTLQVAIVAVVCSLVSVAAGIAESLETRVTMLIGFPASGETSASVTVFPGTVIPVSQSSLIQVNVDEESAEQAKALEELVSRLQRGIGLDAVEVAYSEVYDQVVDTPREITGPRSSSGIRGVLTLVDFNQDLAVYQVSFRQGGETLADTKVAVERGGRAVVGGLDGEEAPYFFLVLQPAGKALFVKGDVQAPRKIRAAPPSYTDAARKEGIEGIVILRALINERGFVEDVEVLRGLPLGLNETSIAALKQWTFEPATLEGRPVAVYFNLTFRFRLDGDKPQEGGEEG